MSDDQELPVYTAEMFASPTDECDIVMKGGVTSGIVYPYAILELARRYRFRSIGGTSAGAIAASLAAAAEYARTVRGDPAGFVRLQRHCDELPERMADLFQPEPRYRRLLTYLLRAQSGRSVFRLLAGLPSVAPLQATFGTATGAIAMWALRAGLAGILLGAFVGLIVGLVVYALRLVRTHLPQSDFGVCPGTDQPSGKGPALTSWLHAAIQDIAFGEGWQSKPPLTFGHLLESSAEGQIDLRVITTNLGMGRPHTLPTLGITAAYSDAEWRRLFPSDLCDWIAGTVTEPPHMSGLSSFPSPNDLPVLVAARMSLSFPLLFAAVPVHVRDFANAELQRATGAAPVIQNRRILFADGGISSNFPIHLFDALLPGRPTFALSLDDLPPGTAIGKQRVFIPATARQGFGLPARETGSLGGLFGSILKAAKDWQDQLLSTMPGQRERIAHVMLSSDEGGLNLAMPPERARALMRRGLEVGRRFADGALDFDEHRWRRSLVAYDQLAQMSDTVQQTWTNGFGFWLLRYLPRPKSYRRLTMNDRNQIHERLGAVADLGEAFEPEINDADRKLPRPVGLLRVGPRY
ncbi:patatin-like phospholipase family protein [Sphingomonas sp. S1-29]|uniref:patatin-like phospholipase family protein n=1 Tax=Sphingomonas sp. S1-29 TaxID=2991074 RepID=UPI00223F61F7|nr:patatin-like phospholipase family protein [Sphingomonas sp. S1-29]UZK70464.1 patatin-like phospholipase family protein [Sphingomonas sp. S1-29]